MDVLSAELERSTAPLRVLVVDDNEQIVSVIQVLLELEGHEVRTAAGMEEGYVTYLQFRPDVVLTDIQMPEEEGLELMRRIRVHDPKIKTIYMSGDLGRFRSLLEEEQKRYKVGLLQKPFSTAELIRLLS